MLVANHVVVLESPIVGVVSCGRPYYVRGFLSTHIIRETCAVFGVSRADILGKNRNSTFVSARDAAAYILRKHEKSFEEIGFRLGDRNHTTIRIAVFRAIMLLAENELYRVRVAEIESRVAKLLAEEVDHKKVA